MSAAPLLRGRGLEDEEVLMAIDALGVSREQIAALAAGTRKNTVTWAELQGVRR